MRAIGSMSAGLAIGVLAGLVATPVRAEHLDMQNAMRRAEAFVGSLFRGAAADHEVIRPSGDIDSQMALTPPSPRGTMRVIRPPAAERR